MNFTRLHIDHDPGDEHFACSDGYDEDVYDAWRALTNPLPPVTCKWCNGRFASLMPGEYDAGTQGDDCAAVVYERDGEWFAEGFYGSRGYDMSVYRFVRNPPDERADPVCDACLNKRVDAGDLVFLKEVLA